MERELSRASVPRRPIADARFAPGACREREWTTGEPLVSIVVPAYNAARYLRQVLDGILAQDYAHIETIVVDDGSADDTAAIARSYGNRVRVVTQANAGQSRALNRGWELSTGSILGYLAADDLLKPFAVSRSVELFALRRDVIVTYCDYELISSEAAVLRRVRAPVFDYLALLERFVVAPGPGAFFRREAFEQAGGWNPAYRQMPDHDFWLRMGLHGEFVRIPEVLASFRVHPESQSYARPDAARADEPLQITDTFFEDHPAVAASAARGRSAARVASARAHLRAGRYGIALRRLREAVRLSVKGVFSLYSLRMLLSGIAGRARYMITWKLVHLARRRP